MRGDHAWGVGIGKSECGGSRSGGQCGTDHEEPLKQFERLALSLSETGLHWRGLSRGRGLKRIILAAVLNMGPGHEGLGKKAEVGSQSGDDCKNRGEK